MNCVEIDDQDMACTHIVFGRRAGMSRMYVVPAEAGIQHHKSLDSGQKHAGMTTSGLATICHQAV